MKIPNRHKVKGAEHNGFRIVAQRRFRDHFHLYVVFGAHKEDEWFLTAIWDATDGSYSKSIPTKDIVKAAKDFKGRK